MKKIMLVDDDPRLRRLVRTTLGSEFQVIEASGGEEAIELAQQEQPDLVFLDVNMPAPDGFATCLAMKRAQARGMDAMEDGPDDGPRTGSARGP